MSTSSRLAAICLFSHVEWRLLSSTQMARKAGLYVFVAFRYRLSQLIASYLVDVVFQVVAVELHDELLEILRQ